MKLDWKRAGCASIAEFGGLTAVVLYDDNKVEHRWQVFRRYGSPIHASKVRSNDFADAETEVVAMLKQHDRPEWHDVTDWLSWAEWRGWRLEVCVSRTKRNYWCWYGGTETHSTNDIPQAIWIPSREEAKSAAEKWVREQGGK